MLGDAGGGSGRGSRRSRAVTMRLRTGWLFFLVSVVQLGWLVIVIDEAKLAQLVVAMDEADDGIA